MITSWLADVVSYSLQLTALVATVVVVTTVVPVRDARWRFLLYQALFVAALLLPISQLWGDTHTPGSVNAVSTIILTAESATIGTRVSWLEIAAFVIAGGASVRLGHLALGWFAIQRYVRRSTPLERSDDCCAFSAGSRADVRLSDDIRSPASVGIWRAVILVPPAFLTLSSAAQRSVLLHEFLHVKRRDWARMVIEEIWCALLWFHPFARVLVKRLDLAREMLVDRCVLEATRDRRAYARALLAFADDEGSAARAVMPLIRPRHLSARIAAVVKEVPMSRRATLAAVCVICLSAATTTATAVRLVPMGAQPPSPAEPFATASA